MASSILKSEIKCLRVYMATVYIATVLENLYKSVLFVTITNKFVFVNVICSTCTGPMIHLKCCILVLSAHAQHQWLALPCSYCLTRRVPFSVSGSLRYRELITSSEYKERSDRRTDVFETYFSSFWSNSLFLSTFICVVLYSNPFFILPNRTK